MSNPQLGARVAWVEAHTGSPRVGIIRGWWAECAVIELAVPGRRRPVVAVLEVERLETADV